MRLCMVIREKKTATKEKSKCVSGSYFWANLYSYYYLFLKFSVKFWLLISFLIVKWLMGMVVGNPRAFFVEGDSCARGHIEKVLFAL